MDTFGDSGELYTIRNQFYTHQHKKVKEYVVDQFSPEVQLKVLEYQIRSTIALGEDASELITASRSAYADNDELFHILSAYNDLKSFGTEDSTYFDDVKSASFELQAVLTGIYLVKYKKDIDSAITLVTNYVDSKGFVNELEPLLVLVQLHLAKGNFSAANKIFNSMEKFPDSVKDNIIYQVIESWILSVKGETDNISNAYYFYDECLSQDFEDDNRGKFKLLNILFVLTLQLKHFPEASEILTQIEALEFAPDATLISNQITYDLLVNNGANGEEYLVELEKIDPEHPLLLDRKEKNDKFDEIIEKYKISA